MQVLTINLAREAHAMNSQQVKNMIAGMICPLVLLLAVLFVTAVAGQNEASCDCPAAANTTPSAQESENAR